MPLSSTYFAGLAPSDIKKPRPDDDAQVWLAAAEEFAILEPATCQIEEQFQQKRAHNHTYASSNS